MPFIFFFALISSIFPNIGKVDSRLIRLYIAGKCRRFKGKSTLLKYLLHSPLVKSPYSWVKNFIVITVCFYHQCGIKNICGRTKLETENKRTALNYPNSAWISTIPKQIPELKPLGGGNSLYRNCSIVYKTHNTVYLVCNFAI